MTSAAVLPEHIIASRLYSFFLIAIMLQYAHNDGVSLRREATQPLQQPGTEDVTNLAVVSATVSVFRHRQLGVYRATVLFRCNFQKLVSVEFLYVLSDNGQR